MGNKTKEQVQMELEAVRHGLTRLKNAQTRLEVLAQFQGKGVTQPNSMPFTAGNGKRTSV